MAREIKARKKISERISPEQLFSAMPPLEAFMIILSLFMSWSRLGHKYKSQYKIGIFDISKAHFYGVARRRVFVDLVEEDKAHFGADKSGLLLKTIYGTQDASNIWQDDYTELLSSGGYRCGASNAAVFHNEEEDGRCLVHGDDFVVLGSQEAVDKFEKFLASKYKYKKLANLGFSGDHSG